MIVAGLTGTAGLAFLVSGLHTFLRMPKRYRKTRAAALRRARTGVFLLLLTVLIWNSAVGLLQTAESVSEYSTSAEEILLDEDTWMDLDDTEKVKVLEAYANQKAKELGIAHPLELVSAELENKVQGLYRHGEHRIYVSEACIRLSLPVCLVEIVAHEVRHAYQYNLAEAYMHTDEEYRHLLLFESAEAYADGLVNYISAEEDSEGYFSQRVEADAREYAAAEAVAFAAQYFDEFEGGGA